MPVTVMAHLGTTRFYTRVRAGENELITDEPKEQGGGNRGFNPYEVMAASLASCTAATLRMYIDRKGWHVPDIEVTVTLENFPQQPLARFTRRLSFPGAVLTAAGQDRLLKIAEACPVHKMLHNPIAIETHLASREFF